MPWSNTTGAKVPDPLKFKTCNFCSVELLLDPLTLDHNDIFGDGNGKNIDSHIPVYDNDDNVIVSIAIYDL